MTKAIQMYLPDYRREFVTMWHSIRRWCLPAIAVATAVACCLLWLHTSTGTPDTRGGQGAHLGVVGNTIPPRAENTPRPTRALPPPVHAVKSSKALRTEKPKKAKLSEPVIPGSDIVRVKIPAVRINIPVSGETHPRHTVHCHDSVLCIDPPYVYQAAWYGSVPSAPESKTVRIFSHTIIGIQSNQTFNNLGATMAGDIVTVMTKTGKFTYRINRVVHLPFAQVPSSKFLWGEKPNRVMLVTCDTPDGAALIVQAKLVKATAR